jgi:hypothetical protein
MKRFAGAFWVENKVFETEFKKAVLPAPLAQGKEV